jgi:hypothetical protein
LTPSFLLYIPVFAALVGGQVDLYCLLHTPVGGKVAPAGGEVAPVSGKVLLWVVKYFTARWSKNFLASTFFHLRKTRQTTKYSFKWAKINCYVPGKLKVLQIFTLSSYLKTPS